MRTFSSGTAQLEDCVSFYNVHGTFIALISGSERSKSATSFWKGARRHGKEHPRMLARLCNPCASQHFSCENSGGACVCHLFTFICIRRNARATCVSDARICECWWHFSLHVSTPRQKEESVNVMLMRSFSLSSLPCVVWQRRAHPYYSHTLAQSASWTTISFCWLLDILFGKNTSTDELCCAACANLNLFHQCAKIWNIIVYYNVIHKEGCF